ncbi:hypothetical protein [Allocoleopsis franciscana]|uniref:Heterocyst differentiation related protein n=1 Tax=Allocoleopsis franciscana PCC 7113 TaxID=1173027 RepID=K9W8G7_9CYAN|nr:hypothetical protein [Allocoleopsis franciscana]AFZ16091.1 hypothetical protein Mic7113_0154 [Allocoleopsis franciscana PCC 7113]
MSDGMAFLTGAAFAGVAVLFLMRGGAGANLGATVPPVAQLPQVSQPPLTTPFMNGTQPQAMPTVSPGSALYSPDQQRLVMQLEQQRTEIEQLKQQLQNQQSFMQRMTAQNETNANSLFAQTKPQSEQTQVGQQENPMLSGLVWALGGMAVTISGGVVVIGALSVLSRQQRPPRTTYVVQHPYSAALPPTIQTRRREYMPPPVMERQVEHIDYD